MWRPMAVQYAWERKSRRPVWLKHGSRVTESVRQLFVMVTNTWAKSTYKEDEFIWAHGLRGFSSWLLDLVAFGPVAKQSIRAGAWSGGSCPPYGDWESKRKGGRGWGPNTLSRAHPQCPNFLSWGPTFYSFHHFSIASQSGDQVFNPWDFRGHLDPNYSQEGEWDIGQRLNVEG